MTMSLMIILILDLWVILRDTPHWYTTIEKFKRMVFIKLTISIPSSCYIPTNRCVHYTNYISYFKAMCLIICLYKYLHTNHLTKATDFFPFTRIVFDMKIPLFLPRKFKSYWIACKMLFLLILNDLKTLVLCLG